MTMRGWQRSDGRKGIRNTVVVAYLVECARHAAETIARPFEDEDVHVIGFPGCYRNGYAYDMMVRLTTHPNVGAVLLCSLGCESFDRSGVRAAVEATGPAGEDDRHPGGRRHAAHGRGRAGMGARRRWASWRRRPPCRWRSPTSPSARSAAARTPPRASPPTPPWAAPSTSWWQRVRAASSRRRAS